jgi:hypothetical protein
MADTLIDDRAAPDPDGPDDATDAPVGDEAAAGGGGGRLRGAAARAWTGLVTMPVEGWISLFIVGFCVGFVFFQLGPSNVLANNTPAGGDMGAHVWGPAYLRDHLLPSGRLSGWTPDWYAGFPAYTFYMVLPSLAIALLSYVIPYGVAFKLVAISGVLSLPVAAWAFGRLTRLPFPAPPMLAVAATAFLFDRSFSIYGGNIASTLAGEFAFSISLTLAVLYLGVLARSLDTGRYRGWAAVLLGLTALCHLIPVFFALAGTLVLVALRLDWGRVRLWIWALVVGASFGLAAVAGDKILPTGLHRWPIYAPAAVFFVGLVCITAAVLFIVQLRQTKSIWLVSVPVLVVGGLLSAFWVVPFYLRQGFLNDMGWEKKLDYANYLFYRSKLDSQLSNRPGIEYLLAMALLGGLLALIYRRRGGLFWLAMAAIAGVAFLYMPQGRLWNARLLPFYYLSLYLLGAVGIALFSRALAQLVSGSLRWPSRTVVAFSAVAMWGAWMIVLGLPLHTLPFGGYDQGGSAWRWGPFTTTDSSFVTGWASWNFKGYEGKPAYPEYYAITQTMAQLGQTQGCGRAMWEHEEQHDRYGTPMALMLLPFWTDGCIGSMEGLYFEASATTPYHFLNQDELSTGPSNAQRDLPYGPGPPSQIEFDTGVRHLQMLGVKYYMAISTPMIDLGRTNPNLTEVASSGPWVVFQVSDSGLVSPLTYEPAVVNGASASGKAWLADTLDWYMDPTKWDVPLAASGPAQWQRVNPGDNPDSHPVGATTVTNITSGTDSISFDVSQVGVPVVVKTSYFPNWQASGADGPYRVSPNLMVVIPTATHVSLHYGWTGVDLGAWALTLLGFIGVVWLARSAPADVPEPPAVWQPFDEGDESDEDGGDPSDPAWWAEPDATHGPPGPGVAASEFDPASAILGPVADVLTEPRPDDQHPDDLP